MEYLEKSEAGNSEGNFLKDWEVIYGADQYKMMKEYIDQCWEPICELIDEAIENGEVEDKETARKFVENPPYSSREELEKKSSAKIQIKAKAQDIGISIASNIIANSAPTGQVTILKQLGKKIKNKLEKAAMKKILQKVKNINVNLYLTLKLLGNPQDLENLDSVTKEYKNLVKNNDAFPKLDEILSEAGVEGINFTEEVNLYDEERYKDQINGQEFRVVVLKKEVDGQKQIVIAYNGKKLEDKKVLPDEFKGLQIVYSKIAAKHPDAEITFTGCSGGADLSFVNALFSNKRRSYTIQRGDTVIDVGKKLIGDDWEGKLKKKDGTSFTRNDNQIYPGQKIYYDPLEADNIKATLFYDNMSDMKELISFTKYNMETEYEPLIKFTVEEATGKFKTVAQNSIYLFISAYLGKVLFDVAQGNSNYLLRGITLVYNIMSCLVLSSCASEVLIATMLQGVAVNLMAAETLMIVGGIVSLGIGAVMLGLFMGGDY